MRVSAILSIVCVIFSITPLGSSREPAKRTYHTHDYYVLEHVSSGSHSLEECAGALGVDIVEQVGELKDHWLVRIERTNSISRRTPNEDVVMQQYRQLRREAKRLSSSISGYTLSERHIPSIANSIRSLEKQVLRQRTKKRAPIPFPSPAPVRDPVPGVHRNNGDNTEPQPTRAHEIASKLGIVDPIFSDQWHLINDRFPSFDLNVTGLWEQGITGKGVYTAVVDDGLDANSEDLAANFNKEGSWDFNDHTNLPLPRLSDDRHGTRCCGEIAAVKNDVCGVGVAYESKIAGLRILSGSITDADEAASLNYGYNQTSIYSCSWGPVDDGRTMEAPDYLIKKAVLNGVLNGRGGKGSIFVFASGNGAGSGDQCNFDGYTNSIYSVTVAAVDHMGKHPYYSESCAANLIVAYSSGGGNRIFTTDVGKNKCTSSHGGTSAAAPLVVGVLALALQVRPELGWRDVQYVTLMSAQRINPDDPDWELTASGRYYSYKYGYGAVDAWTLVELAKTWKLVKPQAWLELPEIDMKDAEVLPTGKMYGGKPIPRGGLESSTQVTSETMKQGNFERLEHVTVKVWISHSKRGDVEVWIVSPNGFKSVLAAPRRLDEADTGFAGWQFMSVKHWGEDPRGTWTIHVKDQGAEGHNGSFLGWSMTLWGECIDSLKAKQYELPAPQEKEVEGGNTTSTATPTTPTSLNTTSVNSATKSRPKPTANLPDDHDVASGENTKPAFHPEASDTTTSPSFSSTTIPSLMMTPSTTPTPSISPSVTPDEGYFSHMGDLLASNTWLFAAIGTVVLFGIGASIFFCRRSVCRRRAGVYSAVGGDDDHAMRPLGGSGRLGRSRTAGEGRTKELYDAFAERGDEEDSDEDANEEDRLVRRDASPSSPGLRYHDEFLDDEVPEHSPVHGGQRYRDDAPGEIEKSVGGVEDHRSGSGTEDGSGSWEHASADAAR